MNKGLTYLEIILGITVSGLIFWISINLMSFIFLRDVSQAYAKEFEEGKAQIHELISNEIAWSNQFELTSEKSFSVDNVEYKLNNGHLLKNGRELNLKNIIIEDMSVKNIPSSGELALVQFEFTLSHAKSNSIFDTMSFVVSQRRTSILKN